MEELFKETKKMFTKKNTVTKICFLHFTHNLLLVLPTMKWTSLSRTEAHKDRSCQIGEVSRNVTLMN